MGSTPDLVSGGYSLARPTRRLEWLPTYLPEVFLSCSNCLTTYVSDNALTGCLPHTESEMLEVGERMGIGVEDVRSIQRRFFALAGDQFEYPRYFTTVAAARSVAAMLGRWAPELTLIGMSTLPSHAALIVAGPNAQHTYEDVLARAEPPEAGEVLGWEVLGTDYADFHSWNCNHMEVDAEDLFGIRPNTAGFIDSFEDAERVASHCQERQPEPGYWAPWLIQRYLL
jgi:hypothetical protein